MSTTVYLMPPVFSWPTIGWSKFSITYLPGISIVHSIAKLIKKNEIQEDYILLYVVSSDLIRSNGM